jgi:hypothetical protein
LKWLRLDRSIRRIAFTTPLTPLAAVCILSPAIFSRRPCGKLSNNEIGKTIKIPLMVFEK